MTQSLEILMAQIDPTVGAIETNAEKILTIILANQEKHDLIIFPELTLCGYPPEDLLFREDFRLRVEQALLKIQAQVKDCHVIIGLPDYKEKQCFNAAAVLYRETKIASYHKQKLPNYGVFDELRYFTPGPSNPCIINIKNYRLGLCICEDIWQEGPVAQIIKVGADALICINSSPFDYEKPALREALLKDIGLPVFYVNQSGGQDELVFDGQSLAVDAEAALCVRGLPFAEQLISLTFKGKKITQNLSPLLSKEELIYKALVCGTRDYVEKNGFPGVLLGLSGGIDSALTMAIAVDALGASRVKAVMMPSRFTADMSLEDAQQQLAAQGVESLILSIEPAYKSLMDTLEPCFKGLPTDTTEENLQARIRGILLMALSNKTGSMVLTTSNKSETAVGYATLYGDMAGGFAVLKDVLKTEVYALARYRNSLSATIPERVLSRPPSAELAENQCDQDSLPDYAILDGIIKGFMENNLSATDLISAGYIAEDVNRVIKLIKRNEYKRRQAAPGVKISPRVFGRDWRYPITSGF